MYLLLTFIFASLSLLYEFGLSQLLTSLTGSSYQNYSLIIGLYTACLGLGSLAYDKWVQKKNIKLLLYTELLLSLVALFSPLYILILFTSQFSFLPYSLLIGLSLIPVVFIGILSGIELPALIYAYEGQSSKIMFADFMGMFISSIVFYNLILLNFSVLQTLSFLSFTNTFCCLVLIKKEINDTSVRKKFYFYVGAISSLSFLTINFHNIYLSIAQGLFLK